MAKPRRQANGVGVKRNEGKYMEELIYAANGGLNGAQ
jgi:hypothetical protein